MGTHTFSMKDVVPVVEVVGEALDGAPSPLAAAACLIVAYGIITGEPLQEEKATKMVKDFSEMMQLWGLEPQA
jgi:hypothetical protein